MLEAIKRLVGARDTATEALTSIDDLREIIAVKRDEIRHIQDAYVPVAEAMADLARWADKAAASAVDRMQFYHLLEDGRAKSGISFPDQSVAGELAFGLFLATNRQAFLDLVEDELSDFAAGRATIPTAQRAARIAEANAELLEMELTEERSIRVLEGAGIVIARRSDLDPRAALASDESLPS